MSPAAALVQQIIVETNTSQQITFSTKGRVNGTQSVNKHNRQKTKKMKEYESASYSLHGIDVDIRSPSKQATVPIVPGNRHWDELGQISVIQQDKLCTL